MTRRFSKHTEAFQNIGDTAYGSRRPAPNCALGRDDMRCRSVVARRLTLRSPGGHPIKTQNNFGEARMRASRLLALSLAAMALSLATSATAQKRGGTLRLYHNDNPPSTSLHEE